MYEEAEAPVLLNGTVKMISKRSQDFINDPLLGNKKPGETLAMLLFL